MLEFLKNFKSEEITNWINEYLLFLIEPRKIVSKILDKENEEKIRQFLFLFLIYTASFIFLSTGKTVTDWIKPAILSLFSTIPLIILFLVSTKIVDKKENYLDRIIVFVLGFQFVFNPLVIIVFTIFLNSENYTFKYLSDIIMAISSLNIVLIFGFAIEKKTKKALKITLVNYLIINIIFFGFQRMNVDPYSANGFLQNDPIYTEYSNLVKPLTPKEKIPVFRFITTFDEKVTTYYGIQETIDDTTATSSTEENELYERNINENIDHIEKTIPNLNFLRNKEIASGWLKYYKQIKKETEFKFKDTAQVNALKLKPLGVYKAKESIIKTYMTYVDFNKIIAIQIPLKWYHNSILENHKNSIIVSEVTNRIIFLVGYTLDYIVGDLILKEGDPKPFKVKFKELE